MPNRPRLIGRHDELIALGDALRAASDGSGSVVFLSGESGVGKTLLAEEALSRSNLDVLTARAREDATPPYGPVATILRSCLRRVDMDECGPRARYLSMLLPELGPAPGDADGDVLVESIADALVTASQRKPAAIFLDDIHWADDATLELLPPLSDRLRDAPLVVLATYRSDEIPRGHALRRIRNDLRRARRVTELSVDPLTPAVAAGLITEALRAQPSAELVDLLHEKTHGIPLYLEELATALAGQGSLRDGPSGMELVPGEEVPIPESIRDAIVLRLDSLSDDARELLEVASVVGADFDVELVSGLAETAASIDELVARNLLVVPERGRAAFRHTLIRDAVRGEIAWTRRRSLHGRIATYLERAGASPEEVAEHWLAANEQEPARRALLESADRSCRLYAYSDAARQANRALEIWPAGERERERVEALEQLAHCAQVSGALGDAVRALREVLTSPLITGDTVRRAETLRALAGVYGLQGAWEQSLDARMQAARTFEEAKQRGEAAVEWLAAGNRYLSGHAAAEALERFRNARRLAEEAHRTDTLARAMAAEANAMAMLGEFEDGISLAKEALAVALDGQHTEAASIAYRRLASVLDYSSDYLGSRDAYLTAVDYCRTQGAEDMEQVCLGCMSAILLRTGEWKRALDVCRDVIERTDSPPGSTSIAHGVIGLIRAHRGEAKTAKRSLQDAIAIARTHRIHVVEFMGTAGLAAVFELEGDSESAAESYRQAISIWERTDERHDIVAVLQNAVTFFATHGFNDDATRCVEALTSVVSLTGATEPLAGLSHALGEVALAAGKPEDALDQFRQALTHIEKLDVPFEHAFVQWRTGTAAAAAGDRDAAVKLMTSAYHTARRLGARSMASRIGEALDALGEHMEEGRHPEEEKRVERGGLTRRQVEIARLVADGLTNKEIAGKLYLSPRTVDMHVGNILERLDCRSRAEAVRKAGELGLLD